jgi:hypothetical protein
MGADGKMKELRAGTNGWMCMLDLAGDSMCLDKEWQAWGDAWMKKKDPPKPQTFGVAYRLKGDKGARNTDPYATKPTVDNQWVVSGPHIMLLPTDVSQLDAYSTDWTKSGPWVMWKGTPYAPWSRRCRGRNRRPRLRPRRRPPTRNRAGEAGRVAARILALAPKSAATRS